MAVERSLIFLKPDCLEAGNVGEVVSRFENAGFVIKGTKMIQLTDSILAEHYAHLTDLPFYPGIADFMKSAPVIALILARAVAADAVGRWYHAQQAQQEPWRAPVQQRRLHAAVAPMQQRWPTGCGT